MNCSQAGGNAGRDTLNTGKKFAIRLTLAAAIACAAGLLLWQAQMRRGIPEGLIQANGRIEGDAVIIASKTPGRIVELPVREGDSAQAGQVLVRIDDGIARARLAQAQADIEAARARAEAARAALALLRREIPHAIAASEAGVATARTELAQAEAARKQDARDLGRAQRLETDKFVGPQFVERAELALNTHQEQRDAALAGVERARQALNDARLGPERIRVRQAELAAALGALATAQAKSAEAQSALDDLTLTSPAAGVITSRYANSGEVITAGAPIFELVDLDRLYLKVFVPEKEIGKVRRGLAARIYSDAFPDQPFAATVRYIGSRAEFTPKEVQTPDERVKLMYEVRLYLDRNPAHTLTPGLPADAMIRWKEDAQWARPRW
ncbi:MAG: HlyD family secretion protein [Burkholderiales bacterium]